MRTNSLVLGIDLGTSGVRIALIDIQGELVHSQGIKYPNGLVFSEDWKYCCKKLIKNIPISLKDKIIACAVDGTSGTLIACDSSGRPLSKALPYYLNCSEQTNYLKKLLPGGGTTSNTNSSLARALRLLSRHGNDLLLRHQADWINGWLIDNWKWGEEGNNLKLGWNLIEQSWPKTFKGMPWIKALPKIVPSGTLLQRISLKNAKQLNLPKNLLLIAGTTDSNAAVLATNASYRDGVTILGSTIVIKSFVESPLEGLGITNHRIYGKWLSGGSSNAGGSVLKKFFTEQQIIELSRQINPEKDSGISLLPLPFQGERFPINDPNLKPVLEPRPISDSLYLHALLEGLTRIEVLSWQKLNQIGAPHPQKIITIGGGARNPQWRRLRQKALGVPIESSTNPPAMGVARLALRSIKEYKL